MKRLYIALLACLPLLATAAPEDNDSTRSVIDEVVWIVGDEAILKSDIEAERLHAAQEGVKWPGDPDCVIPEQIAVQKLFLHQAVIDSVDQDISEAEISQSIEAQIDRWIEMVGSREKLEEYKKESVEKMRNSLRDDFRNQLIVEKMQQKLIRNVKVSPAEVRRFFKSMPEDSIPFVPTEVEVQIVAQTPRIEIEEINRIKDQLREYTDRINRGETSFATLARLYSQDGSARNGGELGYTGRGRWVPEFANVAFNLTDPTKVSKIVETEFGYHIIQLIDKRGDRVNCRHILLKPEVSEEAVNACLARLDSISADIKEGKFTFEDAATYISDDTDTRSSQGLMANKPQKPQAGMGMSTSKFRMQDLPPEIAMAVDTMEVGQISQPFKMVNTKNGRTVCVIAKLKSRTEGHRARITEDFEVMRDMVLSKRREETIHNWVVNKIKDTYVRLNDRYKDCDFEYQGWIK